MPTERLRREQADPKHAASYERLFGDTAVAATLWPAHLGGSRTSAKARELLRADVDHWQRAGFGPWVVFDAGTDQLVGRGGLRHCEIEGQSSVEVCYAILSDRWGHGYATEIAAAALELAGALQIPQLVGFTLTSNIASRRVLEKTGLRFERTFVHAGLPHWLGRLTLPTGSDVAELSQPDRVAERGDTSSSS
jgi:[ribosomal protein S5]-alanine N-acetyltransferase